VPEQRRRRRAVLGTILAASLFVLFVTLPFLSGFAARLVPLQVQRTVGAQTIEKIAQESYFCRDPDGLAALDELVDQVVAGTSVEEEFHVYVVDDETLNAFAAPGGHIVLNRALIDQAQHPSEVAGVLAHEMAHIIEGHPTRGMVEKLGYEVFKYIVPGNALLPAPKLAEDLLKSHHSRSDEFSADQRGIEILNTAGLDSRGLNEYLERLHSKGPSIPGAAEYFSSHPSGRVRKSALQGVVREGRPPLGESEWRQLKAICSRMGEPAFVGTHPG